jgi:serine/threonine-protein kinase
MSAGIPFGNYRLIRRIARGGMAEVFLATQQGPSDFERAVAVKRILPHLADDPQFVEMFMDEARLAAQLSHPNIAHIYEFGRVEDSYFIAMEYIDGIDLSAVILDGPKQPIPIELAARIIADVCAALHYAHSLTGKSSRPINLVHRDISPQNILVSFGGSVKVVDFGIAKAAIHIERTRPGVVRGKYTYMSPEQVEGKPLDGRADLFCAGIVLYELCTCEALFPRTDPIQAMRKIRAGDIPRPLRAGMALPTHLERILLRALARKRDERYRNAAEMQMDLEAFLRTVPQIVSSIVLGDYFTSHYRQLRPQAEAGDGGAKERTLGVIRAPAAPGTAPIDAARRSPPAPEARTIALSDEQARVRREDLAATQIRAAPQAGASGTIHGLETALQPVASDDAETPQPEAVEVSERETIAFDAPQAPNDLSATAIRGEIDAQSTLVPIRDATPPGITIDPGMGRAVEPATIVPGTGRTTAGAFHQVAMTRAPASTRTTRRLRSIGRRLLVAGLVTLVAGAGVLAGYFLSEPPGLTSAPVRSDARGGLGDASLAASHASLDASPRSQPAEGTLEINSRPEGATIIVDGIEVQGTTPLRRAFFAGNHTIVASYPGFEDRAQKVRLDPGQTVTVSLTLRRLHPEQIVTLKKGEEVKPKTGKKVRPKTKAKKGSKGSDPPAGGHGYLTIATTPWSSVFLGERKLGITPFANVKVPAGRHTLRFLNDRGASFTRAVTVRPDQVVKLNLKLPGA